MSELLKRLRLIEEFEIELKSSKKKFIQNLKNNVDDEEINFRTSLLDVFANNISKYKGKVGFKGFIIKRRSRLFDLGKGIAVASGTYKERGSSLALNAEVNGFQGGMKLYYIFLSLFYIYFLATIVAGIFRLDTNEFISTILIVLLQIIFLFGMPYLIMRRSMSYLKSEIQKDFSRIG